MLAEVLSHLWRHRFLITVCLTLSGYSFIVVGLDGIAQIG